VRRSDSKSLSYHAISALWRHAGQGGLTPHVAYALHN